MLFELMGETALFIGGIAFIGFLLQKKPFLSAIEGALKVIIGYIILQFGATLALDRLKNVTILLNQLFKTNGIVPNNELIVGVSQWFYGKEIAIVMLLGMLLHLCIARFTKYKYIFLTGHHILYMATLLTVVFVHSHLPYVLKLSLASIFLALCLSFFPAICQPYMQKIISNHSVAMGHFGSVGYILSAVVAKALGSRQPIQQQEQVKTSSLQFLQNPSLTISLFMLSLFMFLMLFTGQTVLIGYSGENIFFYALIQSFYFTAGIYLIIIGVQMLLAEIIPAFNGIAKRFVPNAIPALDCTIVFPYAPLGVALGFAGSLLGGFIGLIILALLKLSIILPGVVAHFFAGGTAGVFGYQVGGKRGAFLGSLAHGLLITVLPLCLMPLMRTMGYSYTVFSDADFGVVGSLLYLILSFLE